MKYICHLCAAVVLTLALTMSTSAGQMPCGGISDPPPPSAAGHLPTTVADGEISTTFAAQMETGVDGQISTMNNVASPVDPVTQMALSWLHSMLSLF